MGVSRGDVVVGECIVCCKVGPLFVGRRVWGHGSESFPVGFIVAIPIVVGDSCALIIVELAVGSSASEIAIAVDLELGGEKVKTGRHATYVDLDERSMPSLGATLNIKVLVARSVRVRCFLWFEGEIGVGRKC